MYAKENKQYGWVLELSDWHQELKEEDEIEIAYADKKELFIQMKANETILPTVKKSDVDYVASFEIDNNKKELLRKALLLNVKKQSRSMTVFVSKGKMRDFLESFISNNYDLVKYEVIKKRFPYFSIVIFLKRTGNNSYELRNDLYCKTLMDKRMK